jgi:hypothetical protein
MATTSNTYTGDGTSKLFLITFSVGSNGLPYLEPSDVDVYLNGTLKTLTTDYTFANATTIEFVVAPSNGATILLKRSTNDATKAATFFPGSSVKAADLNTNFDQVLYIAQETANDAANQSTAGLQAQITAATNTANTAITTANNASATANGIAGTANTALSNSSAAVTTANAASVTATNAETTANAISTTASTALSTANTAQTTANTAQTTANAALPLAGGTMTGVITYATAQPRLLSGTVNAGGTTPFNNTLTAVDFTSIPSWAKRVTVMFNGVSLSATSSILVQIGTSSSVETTGYNSTGTSTTGAGGGGSLSSIFGFVVRGGGATLLISGHMVLILAGSNLWIQSHTVKGDTTSSGFGGGDKTLSGTLNRVRITTVNVTDTFDAGSINILYEG